MQKGRAMNVQAKHWRIGGLRRLGAGLAARSACLGAAGLAALATRAARWACAGAAALAAIFPAPRAAPACMLRVRAKMTSCSGRDGHPVSGATVRVCQPAATGTPCTPLAAIYTDATLGVASANPFQTDGIGNYHFYAPAGRYQIQISSPQINGTITQPDVILPPDLSSLPTIFPRSD